MESPRETRVAVPYTKQTVLNAGCLYHRAKEASRNLAHKISISANFLHGRGLLAVPLELFLSLTVAERICRLGERFSVFASAGGPTECERTTTEISKYMKELSLRSSTTCSQGTFSPLRGFLQSS